MPFLMDQCRGLTHQLGSKTNKILLSFNQSGREDVFKDAQRLVDKRSQAAKFVDFYFFAQKQD